MSGAAMRRSALQFFPRRASAATTGGPTSSNLRQRRATNAGRGTDGRPEPSGWRLGTGNASSVRTKIISADFYAPTLDAVEAARAQWIDDFLHAKKKQMWRQLGRPTPRAPPARRTPRGQSARPRLSRSSRAGRGKAGPG